MVLAINNQSPSTLAYFLHRSIPGKPGYYELDRTLTIGEFQTNLIAFLSTLPSGIEDATVADLIESCYIDRDYGVDSSLGDNLNMLVAAVDGFCGGSDVVVMDQTSDRLYRPVIRLNFYRPLTWTTNVAQLITAALKEYR